MAIKNYKPTSPARRNMSVTDYSVLSKVDPEKTEIVVVKGYDDTNDLNSYFMTKEQQEKIASHYGDKVEYAYVTTVAYDIHGKQLGSPNKRTLQRTNNGRWYVREYDVRF